MRVTKYRPMVLTPSVDQTEITVQREINSFLTALNSYPDRVAHEPDLSFEQHLISIMAAATANNSRHSDPCQN